MKKKTIFLALGEERQDSDDNKDKDNDKVEDHNDKYSGSESLLVMMYNGR